MRAKLKSVVATYSGLNRDLDRELKNAAGRWFDESGFLFEDREHSLRWKCDTETEAKRLKRQLNKVECEGLRIELQR